MLITLKTGVSDTDIEAALDALAALPVAIPEIRSCEFGFDEGLIQGSVDMALVLTFDSAEDFTTYMEHPAHQAFGRDLLMPIAETTAVIQFFSPVPQLRSSAQD